MCISILDRRLSELGRDVRFVVGPESECAQKMYDIAGGVERGQGFGRCARVKEVGAFRLEGFSVGSDTYSHRGNCCIVSYLTAQSKPTRNGKEQQPKRVSPSVT